MEGVPVCARVYVCTTVGGWGRLLATKILFYKDCSLGSDRQRVRDRDRECLLCIIAKTVEPLFNRSS